MYKLRLTEFVFKCLKGYTVTEFKGLFLQGIQAAEEIWEHHSSKTRNKFYQELNTL